MRDNKLPSVTMEGVTLIYRNFAGKEAMFNDEGDRNFCVLLPDDVAVQMANDGWNVKMTNPRDEGDEPRPFLKVKVSYKNRPPRVMMITSTARTNLDANSIDVLDYAYIKNADLIVEPFEWSNGTGANMKSGITAYLKSLFVTVEEDELERKYAALEAGG